MKRHIFNLSLLLAAAYGLAACTPDDANSASCGTIGEPAIANNVGAYFSDSNAASFVHESDDETDTIIVARQNTEAEATVPITVNYVDTTAISIPSSVTFAAGESTAPLVLTYKGMASQTKYNFQLAIPSEYSADPYKEKDGSTVYQASVVISVWKKIKENVRFYIPEASDFPRFYSDMYQLDGVNQFYISDFLGTGYDLHFSIKSGFNAKDVDQSAGYISTSGDMLYDYAYSYSDGSTYPVQFLYFGSDADGNDIWNWSANGVNFNSLNWYTDYSYVDFTTNYIYLYVDVDSDVFSGYYQSLYGVWSN